MPTLCTEIAGRLLRLDKTRQREAFGLVLAFLKRRTGHEVASLHDFMIGHAAPDLPAAEREAILREVSAALRDGEMTALQAPDHHG